MAVLKSEAKFTEPFVDKREVIVMLSVQGGQATASATELDYDAVHALEQTIVDLTFVADTPQTDVYDYKYGRAFEPNDFCSRGDRNCSEKPNNCEECKHWSDTEDGCADRHGCKTAEDCSTVEPLQTCSVNGRPYDCGNCEYHKCTADEPQK